MIGDKKVRVQIRQMLYTLKKTFEKFKLKHTDVKISQSKFCQLRPTFVGCVPSIPHNVRVCMLHENVRYALESLSWSSDVFSNGQKIMLVFAKTKRKQLILFKIKFLFLHVLFGTVKLIFLQ